MFMLVPCPLVFEEWTIAILDMVTITMVTLTKISYAVILHLLFCLRLRKRSLATARIAEILSENVKSLRKLFDEVKIQFHQAV
jgi:hypothetical protein